MTHMPKVNKQHVLDAVFGGDSEAQRRRLIAELEEEEYNPFITIRLSDMQIRALAEYMVLLPFSYFRPLALYYCSGYSFKRIAKLTGETQIKGKIGYCKDRLTQCMGLTRPIAERYWLYACIRAMDFYPFPAQEHSPP